MNRVTMNPSAPVEREIEVTVTLCFPESQLREWKNEGGLALSLGKAFGEALACGEAGDDVYDVLDRLS